jgi:hypothetical protein
MYRSPPKPSPHKSHLKQASFTRTQTQALSNRDRKYVRVVGLFAGAPQLLFGHGARTATVRVVGLFSGTLQLIFARGARTASNYPRNRSS